MKKSLTQMLLVLFVVTGLIPLAERYANALYQDKRQHQLAMALVAIQQQLQALVDRLVADNRLLADYFSAYPDMFNTPEHADVFQDIQTSSPVISIALSRDLKVFHATPQENNEAILEMDYLLYPENMRSIRRALLTGQTVISSVNTQQQTGQPGLNIRTPLHPPNIHSGLISTSIDMTALLQAAGYNPDNGYSLLLELHHPDKGNRMTQGSAELFAQLPPGVSVTLPEQASWELRGQWQESSLKEQQARQDTIRLSGICLASLLLLWILKRNRLLSDLTPSRHKMTLRLALLLLTLLPIVLLTALFEVLYYSSVQKAARQQLKNKTEAVADQVSNEIKALLAIPKQASFNTELFRRGVLDLTRPEEAMSFFASQLRVQPRLTLLSITSVTGEFFAASRPPNGTDRTLRMQWATAATGGEMRIHWVTDSNQPSSSFVRGNPSFDARHTVWYQQALKNLSMQWYPPHFYQTGDPKQQYSGQGIGVSAPLFNSDDIFIGVLTADIAYTEVEKILVAHSRRQTATLVLAQTDRSLLASSSREPTYEQTSTGMQQLRLADSSNPLLRAIDDTIATGQSSGGSQLLELDQSIHQLAWQTVQIPEGPAFLLAVSLPDARNTVVIGQIWRDALYLGWLISTFSSIIVLHITHWLSQPLQALERWATKLRQNQWGTPLPKSVPIREIASLTHSLDTMAQKIRRHTFELERKVSQRTEELSRANRQLKELSLTDGLTGLANRRCLDQRSDLLWQQARREHSSFTLLMVDIDWFKNYNDHYGHQLGDQTLCRVAAILKRHARRPGDLAARYGGEEFVLMLANTETETAWQIAEQIQADIGHENIEHLASVMKQVTLSIGLASCYPANTQITLHDLFKLADSALYQAKQQGRNQIA